MSNLKEQTALKRICDRLPPGYVKFIPFSSRKSISFEFDGVTVKTNPIYLNEHLNCYMMDLAWGARDKIFGIPIRCGINILQQYKTPLPNLYAFNHVNPGSDVTSLKQLTLFIIDKSVLERG